MKQYWYTVGLAMALLLCLNITTVQSQEAGGSGHEQDEMARMMEKMQEIATPGESHKLLEYFVGDWDFTMNMMGMPPSSGTSTVTHILGGRFIMSEISGNMMGQPWDAVSIIGFDNYKKKFNSVWIDSNGTAMAHAEGLVDQTGKVLVFFGTMDEFMTGEHDKMAKYVYRIHDQDHYEVEIHDLGIVPGDTKVISIINTRKQ